MMVGIGAGNLLGIPWEGKRGSFIASRNPAGVRGITAREGYPDDDDLAQAILLAEACIESGQLDVADLMRRFWAWGELNGARRQRRTGVPSASSGFVEPLIRDELEWAAAGATMTTTPEPKLLAVDELMRPYSEGVRGETGPASTLRAYAGGTGTRSRRYSETVSDRAGTAHPGSKTIRCT